MRKLVMGIGLIALVAATGCLSLGSLAPTDIRVVTVERSPRWFERNRIAIIDITGFIASGSRGLFSWKGTTVADVKEKLERAAADSRVRAVILRINSPGGSVTACDMIHQELLDFKSQTGKAVVACFMDLAASGGYYVALAADHIIAAPTTVTGSVGVIMEFVNVQGLFGKIGLRAEVIKSGEKKDIGSPTRAMSAEEREILQGVNRALFERFLSVLREGRPQMSEEDIATISDARIFTAEQAAELHMIDGIGHLADAISKARALAGIRTADVILYRTHAHYNTNIYAGLNGNSGLVERGMELLSHRTGPAFLYLWSPGM